MNPQNWVTTIRPASAAPSAFDPAACGPATMGLHAATKAPVFLTLTGGVPVYPHVQSTPSVDRGWFVDGFREKKKAHV